MFSWYTVNSGVSSSFVPAYVLSHIDCEMFANRPEPRVGTERRSGSVAVGELWRVSVLQLHYYSIFFPFAHVFAWWKDISRLPRCGRRSTRQQGRRPRLETALIIFTCIIVRRNSARFTNTFDRRAPYHDLTRASLARKSSRRRTLKVLKRWIIPPKRTVTRRTRSKMRRARWRRIPLSRKWRKVPCSTRSEASSAYKLSYRL